LCNEIGNIAFRPHEPLKLLARYAKKPAFGDRSRLDKRSLRGQKIQLAGKIESAVTSDDLRFSIRSGQGNGDLPVEHDEHIHLPFARHKQGLLCGDGLLSTESAKALDHILREPGKGELRPKVWTAQCSGKIVSFFGHTCFAPR
jgi:hypothetical protein